MGGKSFMDFEIQPFRTKNTGLTLFSFQQISGIIQKGTQLNFNLRTGLSQICLLKGGKFMKRSIFVLILVFLFGFILLASEVRAQMGPGYGMGPGMMGGGGYGGWYCPYCGQQMGPGMMGGYGYGMGPGMMGPGMMGRGMGPGMMSPGYGMGPGMMGPGMMGPGYGYGYGPQYQQPQKPLEEKDARAILENYLKSTRNPNLKLGKVEDKGNAFEAEILTKQNSLVDKVLVDKYSGWMRSVY
jgi:hypothetical protein